MDVIIELVRSSRILFDVEYGSFNLCDWSQLHRQLILKLQISHKDLVCLLLTSLTLDWEPYQLSFFYNPVFIIFLNIESHLILIDYNKLAPEEFGDIILREACIFRRDCFIVALFKNYLESLDLVRAIVSLQRDFVIQTFELSRVK